MGGRGGEVVGKAGGGEIIVGITISLEMRIKRSHKPHLLTKTCGNLTFPT